MRSGFPRIFYGWYVVAAAFLLSLYIGGVVFYGFTAFLEPIAQDMGWSTTKISLAFSLRGIESSLLAPLGGLLADRLGPRRVILIGIIIVTIALVLLSRTTSIGMFYLVFTMMAIGMSMCVITVPMVAVANWFHRKVGIATGIAMCGFGFSGLLIPLIVKLTDDHGWRWTMIILAVGMVLIAMPLVFVFRHKPEQYGYLPDGKTQEDSTKIVHTRVMPIPDEVSYTAMQVLKNKAFWFVAIAFVCHLTVITCMLTHVMWALGTVEISRSVAGVITMWIPLASIIGRLGLGKFADRYGNRTAVIISFIILGISFLFFIFTSAQTLWFVVPFILFFGIGYGANNTLRASLIREYFGRASFGAAFGLLMGVMGIGGLIGPLYGGLIKDTFGSYTYAWIIAIAITALGLLLMLISPKIVGKPKLADSELLKSS